MGLVPIRVKAKRTTATSLTGSGPERQVLHQDFARR